MCARILYIEDKQEMLDLVQLIVTKKGHIFVGARNGNQGLELLSTVQPDIILLDLMMPDMDGWEVFRHIRAEPTTAHLPIIVVTASGQSLAQVQGLYLTSNDEYITKPFIPQDLLAAINRALARTVS
jgi:two-component system response regulator VicR